MRDLSWEKRGVQSGAALPYLLTEASLKAAPAASILATEAHAPSPRSASLREQKENRQLLPYPLFKTIQITHINMQMLQQTEFKRIQRRARRL
jgi:hypothetical protein